MVDIHITGVHFQVTDKVKTYIQTKLGALSRFHSGLQKVHVTIHEEAKHGYRVETKDTRDLDQVNATVGVPAKLAGCHTALVGGYTR